MKLLFSLLVLGALTISSSIEAPINDNDVELIINGDESAIPKGVLAVDVNKFGQGVQKSSQKLYPTEAVEPIEAPALLPQPQPPVAQPAPIEDPALLPQPQPPVAQPAPIEDPALLPQPQPPVAQPAPIESSALLPQPQPPVAQPAPIEEPSGSKVIYKDDKVSLEVNVEEGYWSKLSSLVSAVVNWFSANKQSEAIKVL